MLLAKTPRDEMHAADYVFGSKGFANGTGGWNDGIAFLFGLLSVQWTVRGGFYSGPTEILTLVVDDGKLLCITVVVMVLTLGHGIRTTMLPHTSREYNNNIVVHL